MSKKIICESCGIEIDKKCHNQKYCTDCRVEMNNLKSAKQRAQRKVIKEYNTKPRKTVDTLEEKCKEISRYNKEHNTHYSYGEYTALVRLGKIV